jgi:hypothetical protein
MSDEFLEQDEEMLDRPEIDDESFEGCCDRCLQPPAKCNCAKDWMS